MVERNGLQFESTTGSNTASGNLVIIRAGKMLTGKGDSATKTDLAMGDVCMGVFEGAIANKYEPTKSDYKVRSEDGTLFILAETANLKRGFASVGIGETVLVQYNGKRQITKGKLAGKSVQDFAVLRAIDAADEA